MKTRLLIIVLAVAAFVGCNYTAEKAANANQTIYFGGDIITMEGDAPEYVEAVVREKDKIVFVGSKAETEKQYGNEA